MMTGDPGPAFYKVKTGPGSPVPFFIRETRDRDPTHLTVKGDKFISLFVIHTLNANDTYYSSLIIYRK